MVQVPFFDAILPPKKTDGRAHHERDLPIYRRSCAEMSGRMAPFAFHRQLQGDLSRLTLQILRTSRSRLSESVWNPRRYTRNIPPSQLGARTRRERKGEHHGERTPPLSQNKVPRNVPSERETRRTKQSDPHTHRSEHRDPILCSGGKSLQTFFLVDSDQNRWDAKEI